MPKYYGKVGFEISTETKPGVWEGFVEKEYYGDILRNYRRIDSSDKINDDIALSNNISIVADPFAYNNFSSIRYAEYMGVKWKVNNVEVQYPRLILSLGGVYNNG